MQKRQNNLYDNRSFEPLITIGITCFNAEDTIEKAVLSAISQDWKNKEIIVCDDLSSDSSCEILNQLSSKYSDIKVIKNSKNGGPSRARNCIIEQSNGEYIAFFDDDDISYPERISNQFITINDYCKNKNNKRVMCYASGLREYSTGYRMDIFGIGSLGPAPVGYQIIDYLLLGIKEKGVFYGGGVPACSLMMRLDFLKELGGFDESLRRVEDAELAIRAGYINTHFISSKRPLYFQKSTIGEDKTPIMNYESELLMLQKNKDYLDKFGLFEYAIEWAKLRLFFFTRKFFGFCRCLTMLFLKYPKLMLKHFYRASKNRIMHEVNIRSGKKVF
jgi:glycosyltransferase involved in cell wall biosynthesis